ncbi:MAG: hypothetical protein K0R29_43 [Pseudobdellovibrio sp.]|jgi:hypothetical protein|nr:hypothetical protein [Pseudobdellovibrio sp.]
MNFKTWKEQKKVKDQDLVFLNSVKEELHQELFAKVSEQMASLKPSFTEGIAFLEAASELILMGHTEQLFENSTDFPAWQQSLKRLRYPQTTVRDEEQKKKFETLPWPAGSKVKFERRGDKSGVELKVFISGAPDVTKILAALERVQQELK